MAYSPTDLEIKKRENKKNALQACLKHLEAYLDDMLLWGKRDILLDRAIDEAIPMYFSKILEENEQLATMVIKLYRPLGWEVNFGKEYKFVSFKES